MIEIMMKRGLRVVAVRVFAVGVTGILVACGESAAVYEAKQAKVRADIQALESALEMYRLDNAAYPAAADGLDGLVAGGYLREPIRDPWGNPYQLRSPGESAPVEVVSLGADGALGGQGADADLSRDALE